MIKIIKDYNPQHVIIWRTNSKVKALLLLNLVCCENLMRTEIDVNVMSRVMRKSAFCICENKNADQLHGNSEADQRLCF